MTQHEWGEAIRKERLKRGWSQKMLAERAGVHHTRLSRLETGTSDSASKAIEKIAKVLKMEELLAGPKV